MKRHSWGILVLVVAAVLCLAALAGEAGAGTPSPLPKGMVDLGSLAPPGSGNYWDNWSQAYGLNDLGQVVGGTGVAGTPLKHAIHPFFWTQAGGMVDLGVPPNSDIDDEVLAQAINNAGEIIVNKYDPYCTAWKYTRGAAQPWLKLGQISNSVTKGWAINQKGEVAGAGDFGAHGAYPWEACKWSAGGELVRLGWLPGSNWDSEALGINDAGVVVGWSVDANFIRHAVMWDAAGTITDLGVLLEPDPDPSTWNTSSTATGINNHGAVVGYYNVGWGSDRAFLWTPAGGFVDLGTLPGGAASHATAINDNGQVTGWSDSLWYFGGFNHAFRWEGGKMSDLGPLGGDRFVNTNYWGYSSYGYAINKFGQVAGISQNKESWNHAFFIDPKWPTPGLLAFYPFSGNAQDVSGHGYHGQVVGATLTQGYQGQAYSFNGTDQNPHYI
ncbi:MAG: hypothetical protein A3K23_04705, partial [Desulfobacca sp. RBG_16_58_9]